MEIKNYHIILIVLIIIISTVFVTIMAYPPQTSITATKYINHTEYLPTPCNVHCADNECPECICKEKQCPEPSLQYCLNKVNEVKEFMNKIDDLLYPLK